MVHKRFPSAFWQKPVQSRFETDRVDVAILPHSRGVIGKLAGWRDTPVPELVLTRCIEPLAVETETDCVAEFIIKRNCGIEQIKRTCTQAHFKTRFLPFGKLREAGGQIYRPGGSKLACRLEYLTFLTVIQAHSLYIVKRVFSEVHLAVLGIAELYSIVVHSHVIGAHGAYIHRLDSAHTSVVLELHARKVTQCIGNAVRPESIKLLAFKCLGRNHILVTLSRHRHLVQTAYAVGRSRGSTQHPCKCKRNNKIGSQVHLSTHIDCNFFQ